MNKHVASSLVFALALGLARAAGAQPTDPAPDPNPSPAPPPLPPANDPLADPPQPAPPPPIDPAPPAQPIPSYVSQPPPELEREPEPMSEGRRIVVAYNAGFHFGLSPGIVFQDGKTSFLFGVNFEYGFDTGSVIIVPGVRLAAYFTDPAIYVGMPVMKLVYPIDRFAPFIEGGVGVGTIGEDQSAGITSKTGVALLGGGGFTFHFTWKFGLGAEASYQTITGTSFHGISVGPILALAF